MEILNPIVFILNQAHLRLKNSLASLSKFKTLTKINYNPHHSGRTKLKKSNEKAQLRLSPFDNLIFFKQF